MRKYVFLGILGISIVALVSLTFLMAEKPSPSYTWRAVILDLPSVNTNLKGVSGENYDDTYKGWVYDDNDPNVSVMAFIREYSAIGNVRRYTPVFGLEVLGDAQVNLNGFNIGEGDYGSAEGLNYCGFTGVEGAMLPACWNSFLNGDHPKAGYHRILFMHDTDVILTKDEADFTKMEYDKPMVMDFNLSIQGQEVMGSCDQCNPTRLHQIDGDAHGYWNSNIGNYDIYLTRIDENTWKVVVCTAFDDLLHQEGWPDEFSWHADKIWESYCECVETKIRKRTVMTKNIQHSSWVRAPIHYEMLFIRTPK